MTLDRLARPSAGAVTDPIRGAILRRADEDLGLDAPTVLALHTEADHLADTRDLITDVEQRYQMPGGAMLMAVVRRITDAAGGVLALKGTNPLAMVFDDRGAGHVMLALPGAEFMTAIENAVALGIAKRLFGEGDDFSGFAYHFAQKFVQYTDSTLAAHGAPYRRVVNTLRFEWVGDRAHHERTIEPALLALNDPRLIGTRAEFEEALRRRRLGTPKALEDALDEAAKAVESALKVLHDERGVTRPRQQQALPLFNTLASAKILPGYALNLVTAVAGPRNHMASHGQGATVRDVPEELADASIAAAATAITFLAHYLP